MENKQPILSICIPTYNRAEKLKKSLGIICDQLYYIDSNDVELVVSDNCSQDDTREVVKSFITTGCHITYFCNDSNIGPDRNFLKCINCANGKYIWLIGDDDFLQDGIIMCIINSIKSKDFGLVHLRNIKDVDLCLQFENRHDFLLSVNYFITFMTANIFRSEIVKTVTVTSELMNSNLLQVAFYITSAVSYPINAIININYLRKDPNDKVEDNGHYNFFSVFIDHYLSLWKHFVQKNLVSSKTHNELKRKIFYNFIILHIVKILILKTMPKMQSDGAWRIILKNYWNEPYFYLYSIIKIPYYILKIKRKVQ